MRSVTTRVRQSAARVVTSKCVGVGAGSGLLFCEGVESGNFRVPVYFYEVGPCFYEVPSVFSEVPPLVLFPSLFVQRHEVTHHLVGDEQSLARQAQALADELQMAGGQ